ncbi:MULTISPECIES: methylenetetrahydrofolate reductase [NAD(P)H] [Acinetobacter]|uniref:Methylenetetrahydrofolate reductase n=2 Tax=Acinetobacter soli TaxID=487316 RepID=A0AB38YTJ7_9GAMM|nr:MULTISPECIES: methylenetetrahydrofolate reductase [NAD(P)H] [Acinetobacter]ENV60207.1 5,10-methylenetetrahydrofolate reductase [Acinetobacter soli NIPH 2899]KOR15254.1 5,10-methylenetetrahydrofolate reductase [Acinetobacter sp. C15]KQC99481.1 5,10-methylenetetrahydrofolate reductase [Acinetobacter soli]MBO3640450.1 methylenetetrahydrofolate reductase [NAD(P)H] [Acinetobacter soli]MBO3670437.1 methylenetetrahydrofolate reductase [NAD(P)H] [Acinetobacter soli]
MTKRVPISFEFFPPKTDIGAEKLITVHQDLQQLQPEFFSITYGAGGSTRERTLAAIKEFNGKGTPVAPHLSCIGDDKARIAELLDLYVAQGINKIVALRGDLPSGQVGLGELPYAQDLVRFIREHSGDHFHIEVAAYPEMHPQAETFDQDIQRFTEKVNAGANSAITQFFFNPDAYFYFLDRLQKQGITIPVAPGIMPITNASNLIRFADGTGAEIPRWIRKQLQAYGDDSRSIRAFGHEVILKLCERLIDGGAPSLHFYTMNTTEPTRQLVVDLGLN